MKLTWMKAMDPTTETGRRNMGVLNNMLDRGAVLVATHPLTTRHREFVVFVLDIAEMEAMDA